MFRLMVAVLGEVWPLEIESYSAGTVRMNVCALQASRNSTLVKDLNRILSGARIVGSSGNHLVG